ncbi:MAG: F0F1 ATP synthase subunit delta [Gammaproteobacteria bacterium]
MELSWSTFILEIINFLVLVWILKRFLYKPVLDVISARRKSIEDQLSAAHSIEEEAGALKEQYTGRLAEWETERQQAREELMREIEQERARRLSDVSAAIEQEQQKARAASDRRRAEQQRAMEQLALEQGAAFSSRLLAQASGPELEERLLGLLIEDLESIPEDRLDHLREQWSEVPAIEVSSAFVLADDQRERLTQALQKAGAVAALEFRQDKELIAGLKIVIGPWILAANVRDELKGFTEFSHAAR